MAKVICGFIKRQTRRVFYVLLVSLFVTPKTNLYAGETKNQLACERQAGSSFQTDNTGSGIFVDKIDTDRAIKICSAALVEQPDSAKYQFMLARALYTGRQYKKAFIHYLESAKQGYPLAENDLAVMYDQGQGVKADMTKALEWYRKAAEQGFTTAQFNLALKYAKGRGVKPDDVKALKWFWKAAEQGHAQAQYNLGVMYEQGQGIKADVAEALEWYWISAQQGEAQAQYNLGVMYADGQGIKPDNAKALEWYRKAAEQGYAKAQLSLGLMMYAQGQGVKADAAKAFEWTQKAAKQGIVQAQFNMGIAYDQGRGVTPDPTKAVEWYQKAAEQGYASAQFNLGVMYDQGQGTKADATKALEWYRKAAEKGHAKAQFNLGVIYRQGQYVKADMTKALKWYRKAAEQGYAKAQLSLGLMYAQGQGVKADASKAFEWTQKAAKQNFSLALAALAAISLKDCKLLETFAYVKQLRQKFKGIPTGFTQKPLSILDLDKGFFPSISDTFALSVKIAWMLQNQQNIDELNFAFETLQLVDKPNREEAIIRLGLRLASSGIQHGEKLLALIHKVSELRSYENREELISLGDEGLAMDIKEARKQHIENLKTEVNELERDVRATVSAYEAIIAPSPLAIPDIKSLLDGDEALLAYLIGDEESFVFVVSKNHPPNLFRLDVKKKWLKEEVSKLRRMLQLGKPGTSNDKRVPPPKFDLTVAHTLYQKLFEPVHEVLEQAKVKRLVVVGDSALHSLPLGSLVKSLPQPPSTDYRQAKWLIKDFAFSRIPAIHALKLFRDQAINQNRQAASYPFIGFGNPRLNGTASYCSKGLATSLATGDFYNTKGGHVDTGKIAELCKLPNTERELKSIAKLLNADPDDDVFVQHRDTETEIKAISQSGKLAQHRVVAISTHGLLAQQTKGFIDGNAEAGLVFTPPATATKEDDGLLTASEIAVLDFNADWVILSACNTATTEGQEASGLSELSKSFFFAGTRSILATHWSVNTDTTELMLTDMFDQLSQNPERARAVALQNAAINLINGVKPEQECDLFCQFGNWVLKGINIIFGWLGWDQVEQGLTVPDEINTAHPYYWAPFMIIGEGGVLEAK